jgi:hypothetical protein
MWHSAQMRSGTGACGGICSGRWSTHEYSSIALAQIDC